MNDEELQALLMHPDPDGAAPEAMPMAPPEPTADDALQAELLTPDAGFAQPESGPARTANGRVYVVDHAGNVGTVDAAEAGSLPTGYSLASPEGISRHIEAEEYGDAGSQIATGLEGVAQGATLGGYGAVAGALGGDDYDRERRLRAEYNPGTALAGEVVGAVAPALLSGGTGAVGTAARLLPAGLEASLGAKLAASLGGKAAAWGLGKAGAIGARMVATGLEGAADQALRTVLDDAANGDVDVTAERMLDAAWTGLGIGAGFELGAAGLGAAGRAVGRGTKKLAGALGDVLPSSASKMAGDAAFKAAVGRTSIASQRLAARVGGADAVGETLLKRGLVKAGDTVDDIAPRLPAAREAAGEELGVLLEEVAGGGASRDKIWGKVQGAIAPLNKAGTRDVYEAVSRKLDAAGIADELTVPVDSGLMGKRDDEIGLRALHELRRRFDQRPDLKWGSTGPGAPDITTEALRDVRRAIESAFEQASDDFAKTIGVDDYARRLKQAKREYSHLAVADQVAEQGAFARAANNKMGLNDVLAGVAGAASLGPAGALASLASKYARDRFESTTAGLLYGMSKRAAEEMPIGVVGQLTDGAAKAQEAAVKHADGAAKAVLAPPKKVPVRQSAVMGANVIERAIRQASALQMPASNESRELERQVAELSTVDPGLAEALRAKVLTRAAFIGSKTTPPVDPNDPLGMAPAPVDATTWRQNNRYVRAAMNPQKALERLSDGTGTPEDLETLRALTPRLYETFTRRVLERVQKAQTPPSIRQRQRLGYLLGIPMDRASRPEAITFFQSLITPAEQVESQNPNLAPAQPRAKQSTVDSRDNVYASRTDQIMNGGD